MESDNEQYLMVMASGVNFQGLLCTSSDKVDASLLQAAGSNIFFHKSFSLGQKLQKGYSLVANSTHSIWTLQQREKTQQRGNKAKGKKQQKETKLKSWFHRVAGPQLRVVSTMSAGYDHIGKPFRKRLWHFSRLKSSGWQGGSWPHSKCSHWLRCRGSTLQLSQNSQTKLSNI